MLDIAALTMNGKTRSLPTFGDRKSSKKSVCATVLTRSILLPVAYTKVIIFGVKSGLHFVL